MSDIKKFDIQTCIIDAVVGAFNSKVSMAVEVFDGDPPDTPGAESLVATVNFAGNVDGIINIQIDAPTAHLMMAAKRGIKPEEVEDDGQVRDLFAEIGSIVGDGLRSGLNDVGHRCAMSAPSITYGKGFNVKPLKMERLERFVFTHQENYIGVEVGLTPKPADSDKDAPDDPEALAQASDEDIAKFNALDINARVSEAVIKVLDTKLSLEPKPVDASSAEKLEGIRNVGSVSFVGNAAGMLRIHAADSFSQEMAAKMLGAAVEEVESGEKISETLGEIVNIVGENLKSVVTDIGVMCALSTPYVISGTDFEIEAPDGENYERFAFRCDENIIFVEIGLTVSDQPQISANPDATKAGESQQAGVQAENDVPVETRDSKASEDVDLDLLLDIPLEIKVELGRARIKIRKLLNLSPGSAIKLVKLEGEPVDILVNDTLIARGDVIVQNEKYGIRVTEITNRMDRIRSFSV